MTPEVESENEVLSLVHELMRLLGEEELFPFVRQKAVPTAECSRPPPGFAGFSISSPLIAYNQPNPVQGPALFRAGKQCSSLPSLRSVRVLPLR